MFKLSEYQKRELSKLDWFNDIDTKLKYEEGSFCPFEFIEWQFSDVAQLEKGDSESSQSIISKDVKKLDRIAKALDALEREFRNADLSYGTLEKLQLNYFFEAGVHDPAFKEVKRLSPLEHVDAMQKSIKFTKEYLTPFSNSAHRYVIKAAVRSWLWLRKDVPIDIKPNSPFVQYYKVIIEEYENSSPIDDASIIARLKNNQTIIEEMTKPVPKDSEPPLI